MLDRSQHHRRTTSGYALAQADARSFLPQGRFGSFAIPSVSDLRQRRSLHHWWASYFPNLTGRTGAFRAGGVNRVAPKSHIHRIFRAKLNLPRVTTVPSTLATPSTRAACSVILRMFTSIISV